MKGKMENVNTIQWNTFSEAKRLAFVNPAGIVRAVKWFSACLHF